MRRGSPLQVHAGTSADSFQEAAAGGVHVVVLRHTNAHGLALDLLRSYQQGGPQAVHERAADGTAIVLDEAARKLVLARDFVGTTPLYFGTSGSDFAFGTRVADVLAALQISAAPNRAALAALLVDHAAAPLNQTYFQGVSSLPPGCTLIREDDSTRILSAREPGAAMPTRITYHAAVEQFAEHLRNAVVQRLDAQQLTGVLVSGGLDSSALICLAARHGDVVGITYGPQDDPVADESHYIEVLRAHGVRIERVPFYPTIDIASIEQSVLEAEVPVADIVPLTLSRARAAARAQGVRSLLLGTWGDQLQSPFPPPHLAQVAPWRAAALAARYQQYLSDVSLREIRSALVRQSLRSRAPAWLLRARQLRRRRASKFDVLAAEFAPVRHAPIPASYSDAVTANVRAPGQVQAIESTAKWGIGGGLDARLPFVDYELWSFLKSLPDDVAYHDHRLKPLLRDALKDVVPEPILERRDKGDYTAVLQRDQLPLHTVLEQLDQLRRPVAFGLMSQQSADKTLAQLRREADIARSQENVMMLLALDTWLRLFL